MSAPAAPTQDAPRQVMLQLTDEEAHVLLGGSGDPVTYPHLAALSANDSEQALLAGQRSLLARGLVSFLSSPDEAGSEVEEGELISAESRLRVAVPMIGSLRAVRQAALVVVVLHRTIRAIDVPAGSNLTRYLFCVDGIAVVEDVSADGMHVLSLSSMDELEALLSEFLVPPSAGQAPEAGPVHLPASLPPTEVDDLLHHPLVLAEVCLLAPWMPAAPQLMALGQGGCYRGTTRPGDRAVLQPAPAEELVSDFAASIRDANSEQMTRVSGCSADQGTMEV